MRPTNRKATGGGDLVVVLGEHRLEGFEPRFAPRRRTSAPGQKVLALLGDKTHFSPRKKSGGMALC